MKKHDQLNIGQFTHLFDDFALDVDDEIIQQDKDSTWDHLKLVEIYSEHVVMVHLFDGFVLEVEP